MSECELCTKKHPKEIWRNAVFYAIDASDADLPGFIRIISSEHVKEMTDLSQKNQEIFWKAIQITEKVMRETMNPDKINLAQLGNMVPHVHWHVIARYRDDAFFPGSVWSAKLRKMPDKLYEKRRKSAEKMSEKLALAFSEHLGNI
jgi:diadenosine tetraphosphate (Ap4A) HIT family hydrolase